MRQKYRVKLKTKNHFLPGHDLFFCRFVSYCSDACS